MNSFLLLCDMFLFVFCKKLKTPKKLFAIPLVEVKSTVEILQNFVAFSKYMNFMQMKPNNIYPWRKVFFFLCKQLRQIEIRPQIMAKNTKFHLITVTSNATDPQKNVRAQTVKGSKETLVGFFYENDLFTCLRLEHLFCH